MKLNDSIKKIRAWTKYSRWWKIKVDIRIIGDVSTKNYHNICCDGDTLSVVHPGETDPILKLWFYKKLFRRPRLKVILTSDAARGANET